MATKVRTKSFRPSPKEAFNRLIEAFEELLESLEYSSPEFWKELEESRKSGRVNGEKVKKEIGL